ncbi:unnamed protein product [Cyprideis torosa]|uniref:Uncharacterized protein n=1 Tax=Cyprideis torosa TaxID=163714 RepID=A0A7R8ZMS7_9CRUS|nr:unnamed protein product [Cyprideis torosa]CAG0896320.1 unnamed protein product [Cyprideis torosa]
MSSSLLGLILALLAVGSNAACPEVVTDPNFDKDLYIGSWYELYSLPTSFSQNFTCIRERYRDLGDDILEVYNTGTTPEDTVDGELGIAYQPDPNEPGKLVVEFPGRPLGDYWILSVDYEKYASVYACDSFGTVQFEFGWLLSRAPVMDSETEAAAWAAFEQFGIDTTRFTRTYHDENCRYDP